VPKPAPVPKPASPSAERASAPLPWQVSSELPPIVGEEPGSAGEEAEPPVRVAGLDEANVEALLERAVKEAEKAVADGVAPAPAADKLSIDVEERFASMTPPISLTPPPSPKTEQPLALREPPPIPDRPAVPVPGTDESIERILEDVYRSMLSRSLYEVLNLNPFSPLSAVRDSANRLRAKYSPQQYAGYMLSPRARKLLEYVGSEIDRAARVLTDSRERGIYDNKVGTDYGQDRRVALSFLFDAEEAFQRGLGELRGERWGEALQSFTRAAEANPRDPEYLAYRGWATYQAFKTGATSDSFSPNKARNVLERALAVDPRGTTAMTFLARLEKEMGNTEASRIWYERLHKLDPTSDEAVAVLDWMKKSPRMEKKEEDGVWGRFKSIFKKR
jgi:hypothetical protein